MKFGFITTEGGAYFQDALEEAVYGEELGFDSVWLEEHHSIRNHYWPSPLMALAGIATRTTRVLLGTDIVVLPFYHPVRAAEDAAMLDVISGGRAIFRAGGGAAVGDCFLWWPGFLGGRVRVSPAGVRFVRCQSSHPRRTLRDRGPE